MPLDNLSPHTYFGIELEICIDTEYYTEDMGHEHFEVDYQDQAASREWKLPGKKGEKFQSIILSEDQSCKCPKDMTSAEIISPKTNKRNFRFYRQFLLDKVLSKTNKLHQGETCGIHVHWSNDQLVPKRLLADDRFRFLLTYNMYRTSAVFQDYFKTPEFSGRIHHYSEGNKLVVLTKHLDPGMIMPDQGSTPTRRVKDIVTLDSAFKYLSSKVDKGRFSWHGISIALFIQQMIELMKVTEQKLSADLDFMFDEDNVLARLHNTKHNVPLNDLRDIEMRASENAITFLKAYVRLEDLWHEFFTQHGNMKELEKNYIIAMRDVLAPDFQDVIDTVSIDLTDALIRNNAKAIMNIIDLDDMHFEFRIFSLDTLFSSKSVDAVDIMNRMEQYIDRKSVV